jgi:hypothetical protein
VSPARPGLALAVVPVLCALATPGAATPWSERKCQLYARAWDAVRQGDGLDGIGPGFVATQEAFVASGCTDGSVCPEGEAERALADKLSLMAISEGMTGSFLPFSCP